MVSQLNLLENTLKHLQMERTHAHPGNTKGGSITVPLTTCLSGLESAVWQLTIFLFAKQFDTNQSNRRSTVWWYFPFQYSLVHLIYLIILCKSIFLQAPSFSNVCVWFFPCWQQASSNNWSNWTMISGVTENWDYPGSSFCPPWTTGSQCYKTSFLRRWLN
jgi:hypothetical protein